MTSVGETVALSAERDQLFQFLTNPVNFPDYVAGYAGGRVTSDQATGLGSAFEWQARIGPFGLGAAERVVEWQPPARVAYAGSMAGVDFHSVMQLETNPAGGTELRVEIDYSVPARRGGRVTERLMAPLVSADVRASLGRLVARYGNPSDAPSPSELIRTYRRRAARYDQATQLYRLVGFRLQRYRRLVAEAAALRPGDTVVEIGCGTGANFPYLQERIGPAGTLIGVDLTDAMLESAARRVRSAGWKNVKLIQSDAGAFELPRGANAIVSTLALTLCADYERVIARGAEALAPGGRFVVLDLKLPDSWPTWALRLGLAVTRPYAVTLGAAARHPWEALERSFPHTRFRELYFGAAYLAVGVSPRQVSTRARVQAASA